jgi:ATP-dependent exoDNAse (exonuclease V) alpha subunit
VIARRNDRQRDLDNGTLGRVAEIDRQTGALTVITDSGHERLLDATYAAEHLEHAYALTGHGAHGATVEWAGVVGRPSEFTYEWAYTSLPRARGTTRVYVTNGRGHLSTAAARGVCPARTRPHRRRRPRRAEADDEAARG